MKRPDRLGACVNGGVIDFRVWAPKATQLDVVVESGSTRIIPLVRNRAGYFAGSSAQVEVGDRYRYRLDGGQSWPDPASRFQPDGVHGPSQVVDPNRFAWTDASWRGPDRDRMVIYELHVGSFTHVGPAAKPCGSVACCAGTYAGVILQLPQLKELGVTLIELMPLNDFDGRWGWGYDGVAFFAPARCYGPPDELRSLIDRAHALGLGVILDVVYNHFGPAGNYTGKFSDDYVRADMMTEWGPAINLGGPNSEHVRDFFFQNARHWIEEYHVDGFRVDATHALVDDGPRPFLAEFAAHCRASTDRDLILIAEDHRNLNKIIQPESRGGWDFDGVWADDFHHIIRRYLTGDQDGVYQDFAGTVDELATTINHGWLKTGEYSNYRRKNRGTDPANIPPARFIFCLQNHDRVGNRGRGDRLNHAVDPATFRAATAALLLSPQTPMLFMGQEWASASPFFYFTDHAAELGAAIREGRAREFRRYDDFNDPAKLAAIPDPQAESTFHAGQLSRAELTADRHASVLALHQTLLRFRQQDPSFTEGAIRVLALGPDSLGYRFGASGRIAVVHLRGEATLSLPDDWIDLRNAEIVLSTESADFALSELLPVGIVQTDLGWQIRFDRPGAIILAGRVAP